MAFVRALKALIAGSALWIGATAANACIVFREYDETAFLEADLIFVGDLTDYEIVSVEDHGRRMEMAVLTYRIDEVLKGKAGDTIRLNWPNSTFELPNSLPRYDATLVGVVSPEAREHDWTEWLRYPSVNALWKLSMVHQQACSHSSIFPVARRDVATIKRWIAAGAADESELSYDGVKIVDVPARRTGQWNLGVFGGGVFGGGLAILARRRWRRRKAKHLT